MKALLIKKTAYAVSYMVCALIMEFILFSAMGIGLFPQYFWLNLAALTMVTLVIFIVPSFTMQTVMILGLLSLQCVLSFVNESLYSTDENIFTIDMLSLGKEVAGAYDPAFVSYPLLLGLFAVIFFEGCVLFILRRFRTKQSFKLRCITTLLIIFCIMQISATSVYNITIESFASEKIDNEYYVIKSDSYLYDTFYTKQKAFKKFGTFAFYMKNIQRVFKEFSKLSEEELERERLDALTQVDEFFRNCDIKADSNGQISDKVGAFSGSNLIVVMIESGEWYGINKEYTPTLYALANGGIKMQNFGARNKTNISETLGILGSYPKESVFSKNIFYKNTLQGNDFSYSLPNILKADGYKTTYLHNNFKTFYDRDVLMPIFGFDKAYFLENMAGLKGSGLVAGYPQKVKFDDLDSDRLLFETNLDKIVPQEDSPFFTFLTTITMHGNYDDLIKLGDYPFTDNPNAQQLKKNFSEKANVKGLEPYYELITRQYFDNHFDFVYDNVDSMQEIDNLYLRYKRYQAAYMDLDRGMESLIKHLDDSGKLENTTIVMYADHSAYFHNMNYLLKDVEVGEYSNPNVYNVPFFIYNGKMPLDIDGVIDHSPNSPPFESITVDRFTSTFDIVPTILDLLGFRVNNGLYHGNSTLLENGGIFASESSGYFDHQYYSADGEEIMYPQSLPPIENKDFQKKIVNYLESQRIYELMYKYDYFKYANDYSFLTYEDLINKMV